MTRYLPFMHSQVVKPMRVDISQLMLEMQIASESDLISSNGPFMNMIVPNFDFYQIKDDLHFRIVELQEKYRKVIIEYGLKEKIDSEYFEALKNHNDLELNNDLNDSLKFTSYFDIAHFNKQIFKQIRKEKGFKKYLKILKNEEYSQRIPYSEYRKGLYSITNEESQLSSIIDSLKLFSPWWLLGS